MGTLIHSAINLTPSGPANLETTAQSNPQHQGDAPVGYRWVSRRWRVLPDGSRDYAALHGKVVFSTLLPISSKLKPAKG